jgi:hypothetical protein
MTDQLTADIPADLREVLASAEQAGAHVRALLIRAEGNEFATAFVKKKFSAWTRDQVATLEAAAGDLGLSREDLDRLVEMYLDAVARGIAGDEMLSAPGEAEADETRH